MWELTLSGQGQWTKLTTSGGDSTLARYGHLAAFDFVGTPQQVDRSRLVIHGGTDGTDVYDDVWELDFLESPPAWTKLTASDGPPATYNHAGTKDERSDRLFVWGGSSGDTTLYAFSLPGNSWSSFPPDTSTTLTPGPRTRSSLIYDGAWDRVILVGGETGSGVEDDLWDLYKLSSTGRRWTRLLDEQDYLKRAGHTALLDPRIILATYPEVYDPDATGNPWTRLTGANKWVPMYPFMFLLSAGTHAGKLFFAGPNHWTFLLNPTGSGSWEEPTWKQSGFTGGSAAMYYPNQILKCGSSGGAGSDITKIIDVAAALPAWTQVAEEENQALLARAEHNITVLPDGTLIATGGMRHTDFPATADTSFVPFPQIWNPTDSTWSPALAAEPANRDYHSSVVLLPDGRLFSAGGDDTRVHGEDNPDRFFGTIYWPPYLFDTTGALARRPLIQTVPPTIGYGDSFQVYTPDGGCLLHACLMRPGAVTHQFNQDQRFVPLTGPSYNASTGILTVPEPADANEAPPGHYMLFLVDADSVPSIAEWVTVDGTTGSTPAGNVHSGTLGGTTTWTSAGNPHYVSGDLTVGSGATLNIQAGTKVRVAGASAAQIRVYGTLNATDALLEDNCPSDGLRWGGIRVKSGGTASLTRTEIRGAEIGVLFESGAAASTVTDCEFRDNEAQDVDVVTGNAVTIKGCRMYASDELGHIGIRIGPDADYVVAERDTIYGTPASGSNGIYCESAAALDRVYVEGFTNEAGIILISNTAAESLQVATVDTSRVKLCEVGLSIEGYARPTVRNSRITGTNHSVFVDKLTYPDLGLDVTGQGGYNAFGTSTEQPTEKYVYGAKRPIYGWPRINAYTNYYGVYPPSSSMFSNNVDYIPALQNDPNPHLLSGDWGVERVGPDGPERMVLHPARPNPFTATAWIGYEIPRAGGAVVPVRLTVFDASGRRVRNLVEEAQPPGSYEVRWDGRDTSGRIVSSGVYFYRLTVGARDVATRKLTLVRAR